MKQQHRLVIASSTPCKHPVIVLQDVVFEDLHALVEFIYHGEVNVHQQSLPSFLKTAEVLRVSGLTQQAEASAFSNATGGEKWCGSRGGEGGEERERERGHHHRSHRGERDRDRERESRGERERERPASAGDATDINQENSSTGHTTKRAKSDSQQQQQPTTNHSVTPDRDTKASNALRGDATGADCEEPPVDFSTNNNNNKSHHHHSQQQHHHHLLADLPSPLSELVKSEPMDLGCGGNNGGGSGDCNDADSIGSSGGGGGGGGEVAAALSDTTTQDRDDGGGGGGGMMTSHPSASSYLDSKLFAAATGASFNFSMAAALAADSLAGLNNHSHVSSADLAGTSQGAAALRKVFTCLACGKVLCSKASLKRHVADKHASRHEEYRCAICERVYCSRNSLMTHIYTYHKTRPGSADGGQGSQGSTAAQGGTALTGGMAAQLAALFPPPHLAGGSHHHHHSAAAADIKF
ncbi:hypothetical protein LSTR_LSTR011889 [Laodelphax striatellus]|uniref:C2H2-type domain-containing protein n=1 Tax=Laodelphax striatellus TaxID=195883 RepID=A0A482WW35_LAOST|nr:hypothetical protein LSTR_LSTR011889 [Laodelphax striatellus]